MKVTATSYRGSMVPDVPEVCSRCGVPLEGCAVDHPDGWLCAIDCGRPRDVVMPFSQAGLDRPGGSHGS